MNDLPSRPHPVRISKDIWLHLLRVQRAKGDERRVDAGRREIGMPEYPRGALRLRASSPVRHVKISQSKFVTGPSVAAAFVANRTPLANESFDQDGAAQLVYGLLTGQGGQEVNDETNAWAALISG